MLHKLVAPVAGLTHQALLAMTGMAHSLPMAARPFVFLGALFLGREEAVVVGQFSALPAPLVAVLVAGYYALFAWAMLRLMERFAWPRRALSKVENWHPVRWLAGRHWGVKAALMVFVVLIPMGGWAALFIIKETPERRRAMIATFALANAAAFFAYDRIMSWVTHLPLQYGAVVAAMLILGIMAVKSPGKFQAAGRRCRPIAGLAFRLLPLSRRPKAPITRLISADYRAR